MKQIKTLLTAALVLVGLHGRAEGAALDISIDGAYCKASDAKYPKLRDLVTPDWKKETQQSLTVGELRKIQATNPKLRRALKEPLTDLNELAHLLNEDYLTNIRDSLYLRLTSAADANIDIKRYQPELNQMFLRCSGADLSLQAYRENARPLQSMVSEVLNDYRFLKVMPSGEDAYIRRFAVASLEAYRIERVQRFLTDRLKSERTPSAQTIIQSSLAENERRLIRFHFAFPALGDLQTSNVEWVVHSDLILNRIGVQASKAIFWSDPHLETLLGLKPIGGREVVLKPIPFAPSVDSYFSSYYSQLYQRLLSGAEPLYPYVRRQLLRAVDQSVFAAIKSAELKCANPSPCSALAINPFLAASMIERAGKKNSLGPIACACRIGAARETVPSKINLGLGFAAAGSVIAALLQPEISPLLYTAWTLSIADMGAAAAGVYDGTDNYLRTRQLIAARSGGATDENEREESASEDSNALFSMVYDLGTGIVGLLPPAKISMAYAHIPFKTVIRNTEFLKGSSLELIKGATGASPPNLTSDDYSDSWDPRRLVVPLPASARIRYPMLWRHLQFVSGKGSYVLLPGRRDDVLKDLKLAAEQMATSGNPDDFAKLQRGEIRADLCRTPEAKSFYFVR